MPVSGAEITTAVRLGAAVRRALRRPEPVVVLRRRAEVKDEIRRNLPWPKGAVPEVLIVRHTKYDDYGKPDQRLLPRGASDWFKAELKGLHDRGLEMYSAIEHVVVRGGKARRVDSTTPGARKVWVVGRIPYERIVFMDWEPDPLYDAPRFYVSYTWRREAYREVVLFEGDPDEHLYEMNGVTFMGEGGGPFRRLSQRAEHVKYGLEHRRLEREAQKERYEE